MNNNGLTLPPLWLLERRRAMMNKKKGSPYGDLFAAEFDCTTDNVDVYITFFSLPALGEITLDGQVFHATATYQKVSLSKGHHVITWEFPMDDVPANLNPLPPVDASHQVDGVIINREMYIPARFRSWANWALFRTALFYSVDKLYCYPTAPPVYTGEGNPAIFNGGLYEMHVPKGTADAYKASVWGTRTKNIIDDL